MHQAKINPLTPEMLQNSNTDLHDLHIIDQLEVRDPSSARWRTRDDMVLCGHWEGEKRENPVISEHQRGISCRLVRVIFYALVLSSVFILVVISSEAKDRIVLYQRKGIQLFFH